MFFPYHTSNNIKSYNLYSKCLFKNTLFWFPTCAGMCVWISAHRYVHLALTGAKHNIRNINQWWLFMVSYGGMYIFYLYSMLIKYYKPCLVFLKVVLA